MQTVRQRFFALFFVILCFFSVIPDLPAQAAENELRYGRRVLEQKNDSEQLLFVYDSLVRESDALLPTAVQVESAGLKSEQIEEIYLLFYYDHPEYFWLTGSMEYTWYSDGRVVTVTPVFSVSGSLLAQQKEQFSEKTEELLQNTNGLSQYERAKLLHDRVAETVVYQSGANDQNAYGALVEGKAVCAGYARAYQHLLLQAGLPAWYVVGESINPTTGQTEGHGWTLVSVDGQWYYSDVTWDDQGENLFYAYFLITEEKLLEDHRFGAFEAYLPTATATEANYFVKHSLIFDSVDVSAFATALKSQGMMRVYTHRSPADLYEEFCSKADQIVAAMAVPGVNSYRYSAIWLGHEIILRLELEHRHAPAFVQGWEATCRGEGQADHYRCECGAWFWDREATRLIEDPKAIVLSVSREHLHFSWSQSEEQHWQSCTVCQKEKENSRERHKDADGNRRCDLCAYLLPEPEPTPPVTEEPTPPVTEEPTPPVTEEPTPPVTEEPTPPVTEEPTPPVTEEPTPPVTEEPTPPVTGEPTPPVTEEPTPPVTEEPTPPVTEEPTPPVTGEPTPPVTEEPTPPVTEEPTPPVTEEPTPPATGEPTPPVTEEPTPSEKKDRFYILSFGGVALAVMILAGWVFWKKRR